MTPQDASYATVHDYPGGSVSLAPRIGMSDAVLRNKVNPHNTFNHLSLAEADKIMAVTADHRILEALAEHHGFVLVPVAFDAPATDTAILELVTHVWRHNGDVGRAVDDALSDGRITKRELDDIKESIYRVEQAMHTMLARITEIAE